MNLLDFYERVNSVLNKRIGWIDCLNLECQIAFNTAMHGSQITKMV